MYNSLLQKKIHLSTYHLLIILFFTTLFFLPRFVEAAPVPLTGYAWSSNIGWISFDGTGYGVTVDDTTGNLSGYAWSSNIGWIKFDGLSNCPGVAACDARIDLVSKELKGWARACAGTASGDCTTMNSRTDGWDGWISLNCSNTDSCGSSNYKWFLSGGDVDGYVWGGEVVGWVDANSVTTGLNLPTAELGIRILGGGGAFTPTSPFQINSGQDIELEWDSTDATSCVGTVSGDPAAGGFSIGGATSGTIGSPLTEPSDGTSATYTVICENFIGLDSASIIVQSMSTVISLTAVPQIVNLTATTDLTWDVGGNDPAACVIEGPNGYSFSLNGQPASGSVNGVTIDGESDFILECVANGINPGATDTAKVQISGDFTEG